MFNHLDDHEKYFLKDLSLKILLDKKHISLQQEAMRIINKIYNAQHENHESQMNFIFTLIDCFVEKLEKIYIELSESKVTLRKVFDHL